MTQVFISYSRKDLAFVERLAENLQAAGLQVWYDLSGLDGGTRWGRDIQDAIEQCQCFVVVLSPNSVDSEWVEKEFMYANSLKKRIIPLLYQPCKAPMWFINLHFIDVQGENYERNFWVILKAMGVKPADADTKSKAKQSTDEKENRVGRKALRPRLKFKTYLILILSAAALVALMTFSVWRVPLMMAWLAPTPTPTVSATDTLLPTPTFTPSETATFPPTSTPTATLTPAPTVTPATGTVTGSIWWADRPLEGALVTLCTDWRNTCTGNQFTDITKADGSFAVSGIAPGEYQLITKYPGQNGETLYFTGANLYPFSTLVRAGETIPVDRIDICKTDLEIYAPVINGTSVTLSWKPYPRATDYTINQVVGNEWGKSWNTKGIQLPINLQPGFYQLVILVGGPACSQGFVNFTVP